MAIKLKITHGNYSTEVESGKTVTVKCDGKKLAEDLVIEAVEVADVALISFTIGTIPYQAEEGMTWAEWVVNTKYNPDGFYISGVGVYNNLGGRVKYGTSYVSASSVIVTDRAYSTALSGGGAN